MEKFQVFISFRGEDTRAKFTSYFNTRLCQKNIETYIDYRLEKAEEISPALLRAIEGSKISVVVFSENYACSSWCLDELVHIMECRQRHGQIVVPVFYEVDPSNVRKQSNSYADALAKLGGRFEDKVLNKWKNALTEAANIAGWDSRLYRLESEFVEAIVEDILKKLSYASSSDADFKDIIGIDKSIEQVESLLSIDSPNVVILGIWGMGGVGKTTLARVVFKRLSSQYEGCCFLANVREESGKQTIDDLEVKLVSELLEENGLKRITSFVKDRLCRKKVLIVLDDVNDPDHLEVLAGDHDRFGHGSRIIVTTRDAQVLRDRADEKYELKGLHFDDALELFYLNAFKRISPTPNDIKLSKRVVNYVEGIPLALKVLGSFLRSKRKENWDHELNKLKEVPNEKIHNVLKVSYDGLDKMEKSIFLDIACFFTGQECRDYVECVGGRDSFVDIGIDSLIDKSLVSVEDNTLVMHDLVREMGWEIVRQQSFEEPGKRSRIWSNKDVYHIFKNNTGTAVVEGISLDNRIVISAVDLSPTFFRSMYKLRLLNFDRFHYQVQLPQGLEYLPDTLTCLVWFRWPLKSLPSNFVPHSLVELKMQYSNLEKLWNGVQDLRNLKHIDLHGSQYLTELPDLSGAFNLESINLSFCRNLRQASSRIRFRDVDKLTSLNQSYRKCIHNKCWTLGSLKLRSCGSLKILPEILGTVKELHLGSTSIAELPSSICSLESLEYLDMSECRFLKNLPGGIGKLKSLKYLNLNKCYSLDKLPDQLPRSVVKLFLEDINIEQLQSSSIESLSCLEELNLSVCTRLSSLPPNIWKLKSLKHLKLSSCWILEILPEILEPMEHLETLSLSRSGIRKLPFGIENLIGLQHLEVRNCTDLEILPPGISKLSHLREIDFSGCSKLVHLPPLTVDLRALTYLNLSHCNLSEIPNGISFLESLETLILSRNTFKGVPESIKQLCKLVTFEISNCKNLKSLPELPLSLECLDASGCKALEIISDSRARAVLTQVWWDDNNAPKRKQFFSYYDCLKLDQNTCNGTVSEFQIRSLRMATISVSKQRELKEFSMLRESDNARVCVCCPGEKIPEWFNHKSEASSLNVSLPSCWHNKNFLGIALCAVVVSQDCRAFERYIGLYCTVHLKTNNGKSKFEWKFAKNSLDGSLSITDGCIYSKNMFMWYNYENYRDWHDVAEISFEFSLVTTLDDEYTHHSVAPVSCKVTSCGIHLLYLQDVEEFGIATDQYVLGNNPEPS